MTSADENQISLYLGITVIVYRLGQHGALVSNTHHIERSCVFLMLKDKLQVFSLGDYYMHTMKTHKITTYLSF